MPLNCTVKNCLNRVGRKDLGSKVSVFLVKESSWVAMRIQRKSSCVLLAKMCRQMPAAELMNWINSS